MLHIVTSTVLSSRQEHHQRDRESMMDGLWSVKSDHVQQLLTESVLLTEDPEVIFVERLLYHVASTDNLPAEVRYFGLVK